MIHEPECPYNGIHDLCPTCTAIRSAYQRGREDAANDVRAACRVWQCSREETIHYSDAARGDGERSE